MTTTRTQAFGSLRLSLLAAIGVTTAACGGTTTLEPGDSGTGGGGTGGSGTGGSGGGTTEPCENAVPIFQPNGEQTGFFACPDGTRYRAVATTCDTAQPGQACAGDETYTACLTDADCTDRPYGRCMHSESLGPGDAQTYCGCVYSCATDADCADNEVCACSGVLSASRCIRATCGTNDDCLSGECGLSVYDDGCSTHASLHCRSAQDECRTAEDCTIEGNDVQCAVDSGSSQFACLTSNCAIGRPLMVQGSARATRATARGDWNEDAVRPNLEGLEPAIREALAARWSDVAAMEHASVASFARFTLQLMALGAPPDLLAETQQAAADEVQHARMAYAVASAYAAVPTGPGALDLADVRIDTDRARVLRGLIEEACVGEALGVAEARAYADAARDPAIASLLAKVADDEERHAALAWRTLRWMLHGADQQTLEIAKEAFEQAMEEMRREPPVEGPVAQEHGLWSASQVASLRRRTLDEVVRPCAQALFDEIGA